MTKDEIIARLVKENLEIKDIIRQLNQDANNIRGVLYSVGGGLNDNIKQFNKSQSKDLFTIAEISKEMINSIPKELK